MELLGVVTCIMAVLDDPDSDIFQWCYDGSKPTFRIMEDCDRLQSVVGFCCYPNDLRDLSELCNSEEAFSTWHHSMETPGLVL